MYQERKRVQFLLGNFISIDRKPEHYLRNNSLPENFTA